MRTTVAASEFTGEPLHDHTLYRILDTAVRTQWRQPSGCAHHRGPRPADPRSPLRVVGARGPALRGAARYRGGALESGEPEWCGGRRRRDHRGSGHLHRTLAQGVRRPRGVSGSQIRGGHRSGPRPRRGGQWRPVYPLVWNILLAARGEGYGGNLSTMVVPQEPQVQKLLGMPDFCAVAAVLALGKPPQQLTRLRRKTVDEFVTRERFNGPAYTFADQPRGNGEGR